MGRIRSYPGASRSQSKPPHHSHTDKEGDADIGAPPLPSLLKNEVAAAVLLPASFIALCAEGFLLAVADRLYAAGTDAACGQRVLHCAGTLVAQSDVVFGRPALVAVSLNRDVHIGVLAEELDVGLHRSLLVGADIGLVIVEINIFDVLIEDRKST